MSAENMPFISYGQNFEDVMLWRALKHVANGFYVDVGANDPEFDSLTKAFYDRGWRGINIEPVPEYHRRLCEARPRDINLAVAAGAENGELTLFDVPSVRGWASPDREVAESHRKKGFVVEELKVPVRRLSEICSEHVSGEMHFLKIDVEGFEAEVIRGMDFGKWRPWILVVEATLPDSEVTSFQEWEQTITDHAYRFAYFDGLNRYYIAEEHKDLLSAFMVQPNVFDDFVTIGQARAEECVAHIENRLQEAICQLEATRQEAQSLNAGLAATQNELEHASAELDRTRNELERTEAEFARAESEFVKATAHITWLETQLSSVYASTSWRITRPVRAAKRLSLLLRERIGAFRAPDVSMSAPIKRLVGRILRWLIAQQRLRSIVVSSMARFPALDARVRKFTWGAVKRGTPRATDRPAPSDLPAGARKVLADIQRVASKDHH